MPLIVLDVAPGDKRWALMVSGWHCGAPHALPMMSATRVCAAVVGTRTVVFRVTTAIRDSLILITVTDVRKGLVRSFLLVRNVQAVGPRRLAASMQDVLAPTG